MCVANKLNSLNFSGPRPLWDIFRTEWKWWMPGAILSFMLASVLMSGWPGGLIPNFSYPYTYHGDGISHSWMVQRVIEGWIFDNPRSGYPFGSNFLDYPSSDSGNFFVLKLLGSLTGEYHIAFNLYFLLGFVVTYIASFCVLKAFYLEGPFSFAASSIFVFLPFHFLRLEHPFYTWYFVVPFFFYAAFYIFYFQNGKELRSGSATKSLGLFTAFVVLASFGVYYAFFGVIVLSVAGFMSWVKSGWGEGVRRALAASLIVIFGVLFNVGPFLFNKHVAGPNSEVAVRSPVDAEVYGFKMMQLLLPRPNHRINWLAGLTGQYNSSFPLVNENLTATLGVVGGSGFLLVGVLFLVYFAGGKVDPRLALLTSLVFVLFFVGTIGGLGALFSSIVSSSIRGWNRISVFIAFGSITVFFLVSQFYLTRFFSPSTSKFLILFMSIVVMAIGIYDQTIPACQSCNEQTRAAFEADKNFVEKIEKLLPSSAAIYQLPYMSFPEVSPLNRLDIYDLSSGFLHSKSLRWSYAGMKGREGDLFFRSLAQQPIAKQIEIIKKLGFSGIYLDRRGFADDGRDIEGQLRSLLGVGPELTRDDDQIAFYRITPTGPMIAAGTSSQAIMKQSGFNPHKLQASGEGLAVLPRQVGHIKGEYLQSDGRKGFLLYGPYVSMDAGVYRFVVSGIATATDAAFVDVVSRGGTVQHFKAPLSTTPNSVVGVLATGVVTLDVPVTGLEIRVFVTEGDCVELISYELSFL